MSSYIKKLKHPKTGKEQKVLCIDDFFGGHQYGYGFRIDGKDADWKTELSDCDFFRDSDFPPVDNQATNPAGGAGYDGDGCVNLEVEPSSGTTKDNQATNEEELSLCPTCGCMTKTVRSKCGKCGVTKDNQGDWESNCCCAEIDVVDDKYGICRQCNTRIGYHKPEEWVKYEKIYTEEEMEFHLKKQKKEMKKGVERLFELDGPQGVLIRKEEVLNLFK